MSTVLIVDDHELIRRSVRDLLSRDPVVDVCGEAVDGKEALEKVGELRPDIVLLDIQMPRMNGIQAAQEIHRALPSTKIVFFTIHPLSLYEDAPWSNGFVSKLSTETHLIPTLNRLSQAEPQGLTGPLKYQWQHAVVDVFATAPESLPSKIEFAEKVIAMRLTDLKPLGRDEQVALNKALQSLQQFVLEPDAEHAKAQENNAA